MPSQNTAAYADKVEIEAWRQATFVVVSLAALVFFAECLFGPIFEVVFEICIFYVPALTIAVLYLYFRTKLSVKSQA